MHPKLKEAGMTDKRLERMRPGAVLYKTCPDCGNDIFYTLSDEYYTDWLKKERVPMILFCRGCGDYKFRLKPEDGELLYEKKGEVRKRESIPLMEFYPDLP